MDVSMEKGGWHLECSARDTEAISGRKINLEGGLGLKHSLCTSNQIDMLNTGYASCVEENSISLIFS